MNEFRRAGLFDDHDDSPERARIQEHGPKSWTLNGSGNELERLTSLMSSHQRRLQPTSNRTGHTAVLFFTDHPN